MEPEVETELRELEESLWRPETRFDDAYMRRVLAPDFFEFGRSGRIYVLEDTLAAAPAPFDTQLPLPGFTVREPAPGVALVTYVSRVDYGAEGVLAANRSSLWIRHGDGWRLAFHQGTPV